MFSNNINGNRNRIKIKQNNGESSKVFIDIMVGLIVTVVGGILLYLLIGG